MSSICGYKIARGYRSVTINYYNGETLVYKGNLKMVPSPGLTRRGRWHHICQLLKKNDIPLPAYLPTPAESK